MIHRIARTLLNRIPAGTVLPILSGSLRGGRWIVGAGTHGCWLGTYERPKQRIFARSISPDSTVFDVGANVGFYTLLAARRTGGPVHAFEPFPANLETLRRHIDLNRCQNVQVHDVAVSDAAGVLSFASGDCPETGRLDAGGETQVKVIGIDEEISAGRLPCPDVVKIDAEGAESDVLRGAQSTLTTGRPILLVAVHGTAVLRQVQQILDECRYGVEVEATDDGMYEVFAVPRS
jgi:FkbM family methyltransferase